MMLLQNLNEPDGEFDHKPPDHSRPVHGEGKTEEIDSGDEEPRDFASDGQVVIALQEAFNNDPDLFAKLTAIAFNKINLYFNSKLLNDLTADDVVQECITFVLSGRRKWYRQKVPNIVNLLIMVITSFIRNEKKKKAQKIISIAVYDDDGELCESNIAELQRAYIRDDLNNTQFSNELETLIDKTFIALENDTVGYFVLEELLNINRTEIKRPEAVIADNLKITENEVKNAIRRIRRKVLKIIK